VAGERVPDRREVFVGVDIGTTATKALAYRGDGSVAARARETYPLDSSRPHRVEQDPELILEAVSRALAAVGERCRAEGQRVAAVAFSAAMHSIMALGPRGELLTRSITWADSRATAEAAQLRESAEGHALYRRTGTPLHPMSPLPKLVWYRRHEPNVFARAAHWISIKEYVLFRLFGELVVDHSIASASGLLDVAALDWDDGALEAAGITRFQLSTLVPATHVVGRLERERAAPLELDPGTPVVIGASDGALANLGVGAVRPGIAAVSIGTSGAVRTCAPAPLTDPEGRTFCFVLADGIWVLGGAVNSGGVALAWLHRVLEPEPTDDFDRLTATAEDVPAGSEGLVFLPYLFGERAPHWNPEARAVFFGLSVRHGRGHLVRAVMEGVCYQLLSVLRALEDIGERVTECRATGGATGSALWRQIMADVFGSPVSLPADHESSSLGAALMAMRAVEALESLEAAEDLVRIRIRLEPTEPDAAVYRRLMPLFADLYRHLERDFRRLAEIEPRLPAAQPGLEFAGPSGGPGGSAARSPGS
jgi:gluconokinase